MTILTVEVHKEYTDIRGDIRGSIRYDDETKDLLVDFPDMVLQKQIQNYLTSTRKYKIPESEIIDDYRTDKVKPTTSMMYMELALCSLYGATGVLVDWDTEKQEAK